MSSRQLRFENNDFHECHITKNKTIISLIVEHVNELKSKEETLAPINHMRIRKKLHLPHKLTGLEVSNAEIAFSDLNECSSIQ